MAALGEEVLPERPGRREPRAVKRRPKPCALLDKPRHQFKGIPHRTDLTPLPCLAMGEARGGRKRSQSDHTLQPVIGRRRGASARQPG